MPLSSEESKKWADVQLTSEQAIAFANSDAHQDWTSEQIVRFQLFQEMLCMDFGRFHAAIEDVFGRPVFTHEFAYSDNLKEEYLGTKEAPTFDEIVAMLPAEKRIIITA